MSRLRRTSALLLLTALAVLVAPASPAFADSVDDAIEVLATDSVYVDPDAAAAVDVDAVRDAIGSDPVLIAILPADAGDALDAATRIGLAIPGTTVAVLAPGVDGTDFRAGSELLCAGTADTLAGDAVEANFDQLQDDRELTALLVDFVEAVRSAPDGECETLGDAAGSSGGNGLLWLGGIGLVALAGGGGYVVYRNRQAAARMEGLRAEVTSMYDRLAADVSTLDPGEDPVTRQALADASERYTSTGAQLSQADTEGEYAAVRRTAVEGLMAARTVRERLGLDPGPPIPPVEQPVGEQLTEAREVPVGDQTQQGYPTYTPGAPYYWRGGYGVPGGWYRNRFWEGMVFGSALGGGRRRYGDMGRPGGAMPRMGGSGTRSRSSGQGDWGRSGSGTRGDWGGGRRRNTFGGGRSRNTFGGGGRSGGRRGGRNSF
ncbi:MAG: hypothetical protein H0T85_06725 [Geodermatophilaceae bacterium]|nr:hypothetical protein [Geodermatophilaceae bacterium]